MAAPPPMQFAQMPGLMQGGGSTTGDALSKLGKSLGAANKKLNLFGGSDASQPVDPGQAVQGGAGPIVAGGPQGPAPLPGQQALPGSPYSTAAGPPAPPPGPPPGSTPLVPGQPPGGAMSSPQGPPPLPPGGVPMPQPRPLGAPPFGAPGPAGQPSGIANLMQTMAPAQRQALLAQISGGLGGAGGQGVLGSQALGGAGMIPSWASMGGPGGFGG